MRTKICTEVLAAALFAMAVVTPASAQVAAPTPKITAEQASEIALKQVPGRVTSVVIERKRGRNVYVVEIMTNGGEKDVFVDIETGRVVGTD